MALVVETGSVVEGAESYVDVAAADIYHANRGNTAWAALNAASKEQALRKATAFIDGKYRLRWKGGRVTSIQPLCWPRWGVEDEEGFFIWNSTIPPRLKDAVCEAALRSLTSDLVEDVDTSIKRQKIDIIETEFAIGGGVEYRQITMLLSDLIRSGNDLVRG